jgi:hypothetical protein
VAGAALDGVGSRYLTAGLAAGDRDEGKAGV